MSDTATPPETTTPPAESPAPAAVRKTRGLNFLEAMTALVDGYDVHLFGTTLRKTADGVLKITNGVSEALPTLHFSQESVLSEDWSIIE